MRTIGGQTGVRCSEHFKTSLDRAKVTLSTMTVEMSAMSRSATSLKVLRPRKMAISQSPVTVMTNRTSTTPEVDEGCLSGNRK